MRRSLPILSLVAWTVFVWGGRLRNIVTDAELSGGERAWRLALACSFLALAVGVAAARWRPVPGRLTFRRAVAALAGWTIVVWLVRGVGITIGDHPAAFIAVHLVLAAVSIGVAVWSLRAVSATTSGLTSATSAG